jgi:hypothetical protein
VHAYEDKIYTDKETGRLITQLQEANGRLARKLEKYTQEDVEVEKWIAINLKHTSYLDVPVTKTHNHKTMGDLRYHGLYAGS